MCGIRIPSHTSSWHWIRSVSDSVGSFLYLSESDNLTFTPISLCVWPDVHRWKRGLGLKFSLWLFFFFHSSHHHFIHWPCEQPRAKLWITSARNWQKIQAIISVFKEYYASHLSVARPSLFISSRPYDTILGCDVTEKHLEPTKCFSGGTFMVWWRFLCMLGR